MKKEKQKKKTSVWIKLMPLMIVGALGTAAFQNGTFNVETPMNRVVRGLKEHYETMEVLDIDCSEFSCVGVDGVYIEIPEWGTDQGVWVYRYADKSFVKASIEQYDIMNTIPNMPKSLYYGEGNYFITSTHGITQEQFNEFIQAFIESEDETE